MSSPSETLQVDNQPVGLTLSGPTNAPSSAGTQYVTATATAGPSGFAGIACSADGSPYEWYPAASTLIPVNELGRHQVTCHAQNNSLTPAGAPAVSPAQSWTLTIAELTEFAIGFSELKDAPSGQLKFDKTSLTALRAERQGTSAARATHPSTASSTSASIASGCRCSQSSSTAASKTS